MKGRILTPLFNVPYRQPLSFLSVDTGYSRPYLGGISTERRSDMSVIRVTDSTFQNEVIEGSKDRLVMVEFIAKKKVNKNGEPNTSAKMDTLFQKLESAYAEKVKFASVEIELDESLNDSLNPLASVSYDIYHAPTMLFIRHGKRARENLVGLQTRERLLCILAELLSVPQTVL